MIMSGKISTILASILIVFSFKAQEKSSYPLILNDENFKIDVVTASQSKSSFAGITNDASLIVAQKKIGNYNLPDKMDIYASEGAFRPKGFPENEYLYYTVFDVTSFLSPFKIQPLNRELINYNISSTRVFKPSNKLVNSAFNSNKSWSKYLFATRYNLYRHNFPQNFYGINNFYDSFEIKPSRDNVSIFVEDNAIVCFTENCNEILTLSLDGYVQSRNEIQLNAPFLWSDKGRGVVKDEINNEYFIYVETNFSYNWFSVNTQTGKAKFIMKLDDIWENPNFKIESNMLTYEKLKGDKLQQYSVYLKK